MLLKVLIKNAIGLFFLLIISAIFAAADDEEQEPKIAFPELPVVETGKQRLYIARNSGDVSKAYQKRNGAQITERVVEVIVLGGHASLSDKVDPFNSYNKVYGSKFELYSLFEEKISPVLSLSGSRTAAFLDLDESSEKTFVFGVSHFAGKVDPDVGQINFTFKSDKTHVLVMARQEYAPDQEKYKKHQDALVRQAEEEDNYDFVAVNAMGKWGLRVLLLDNEDAQFCQNLRITPLQDVELKKEVLKYSLKFVDPASKLKSNTLFNLACMTIARSKPAEEPTKRYFKRAKKVTPKFALYGSHVSQAELQAEYIELKKFQ